MSVEKLRDAAGEKMRQQRTKSEFLFFIFDQWTLQRTSESQEAFVSQICEYNRKCSSVWAANTVPGLRVKLCEDVS